jgi:hypothetical protein
MNLRWKRNTWRVDEIKMHRTKQITYEPENPKGRNNLEDLHVVTHVGR